MSIFVQMVSYKGFDLLPTFLDCIHKAKSPESLHFGICIQQDSPHPPEISGDRVRVESFPIRESLGHGWARAKAQNLYDGQDYTLQVEGGSRFAQNWDDSLINSIRLTGSDKAIVTNHANKFNPDKGELEYPEVAYKSQAFQFIRDAPSFWPSPLKNIKTIQHARNVSDHFFFTRGGHCSECKYDPLMYYSEIDSALSLRSFTLGYDIFHYFKPIVFRNYMPRPMNWNDDPSWAEKDRASKERFSMLVSGSLFEYGLGSQRTLRDWELYSGIDYLGRRLQRETATGVEPPCKYKNEENWESEYTKDYSLILSWDSARVEDSSDYDYWMFVVEDDSSNVISRQDLRWERDKAILEKKISNKRISFKSIGGSKPSKLVIQPFSKSKGGLAKVNFDIDMEAS